MKTIIAPTDFSSVSYNACLYAAKMAEDIKAELVLLHVMELPVVVSEFPVSVGDFGDIAMEDELNRLADKLRAATSNNINIYTENVMGSVEYLIQNACEQKEPFAVVMGTHSYSFIDRFFIGSTTVYSARHLQYPVLVVPKNVQYKPFRKIALATDMKNVYEIPAKEIEMILNLFDAELQVFYVAKDRTTKNRNSLPGVLLNNRLVSLAPKFFFVEEEDILKGISALTEEHGTDLLMVIPKKHGPFHRSQSKDFIFYSNVPVMALHENDVAEHASTM